MVTEKWCSSNPSLGFANHFDNIFNTFSESVLDHNLHTLHFDESYLLYRVHIDQVLLNYCLSLNIKVVFFSFGKDNPIAPSISCIEMLKEKGIFTCFIWYDNNPSELSLRVSLRDLIDLNIIIDYPRSDIHDSLSKSDKDLYLWTPESEYYFRPESQNIDVSFVGSCRYKDRANYISRLKERVPDIIVSGGQREEKLSFSSYASLIRRTKIGINFCKNPMGNGYSQTKGRVFEIIASKSLLLEEKNESTPNFFTPNEDYIEFSSIDELVDKINYFKQNESERIKIAESGYNKYTNNYTSKHFWNKVMEKIK